MKTATFGRTITRIALSLALITALVFGGLAWRDRLPRRVELEPVAGTTYVSLLSETPLSSPTTWRVPEPLGRGREWQYDLFTPPEIFFDPSSGQFAVRPLVSPEQNPPQRPLDLELIGVRQEPFRLQLIGHVGEGAEAQGVFQNRVTSEVFLAQAGRDLPELRIRIDTFHVRPERVELPDGMAVFQRVATAAVSERDSSRQVALTDRKRQPAGRLFALIKASGEEEPRAVSTGDQVESAGTSYRVGEIYTDPASVEIVRATLSSAAPDRRILLVRSDPADGKILR